MTRITQRKVVMITLSLVGIWLAANLCYRWVIAWRIQQHERSVQWTADGVHPAAQPYSLGSGKIGVLLVHGINDTPEVWDRFAPEIASQGLAVRVMRLPGFGESTERYGEFDRSQWIEAVAAELRAVRKEHRQVVLVGHSLGGAISIGAARLHPELLDGLVLLSPAIAVSDARSPLLSTRTWHRLSYPLAPLVSVTESPFEPDALDPRSRHMASRSRFVPRHVVDELFSLLDENHAYRDQIKSPTLIIVAAEDQVVDNDAAERFADDLLVETEFMVQEGSGHMMQRDYHWSDVAHQVATWVSVHANETTNSP